jgi:hypothetical protein
MSEQPQHTPELHSDERASVTEIDHVKIVGYQEFPVAEDAVIGGEPWKAIGAGLGSEGQELVLVENPMTHDRILVRGDHLRSTERFTPDVAAEGIGAEAVEQTVANPEATAEQVSAEIDALLEGLSTEDKNYLFQFYRHKALKLDAQRAGNGRESELAGQDAGQAESKLSPAALAKKDTYVAQMQRLSRIRNRE